MKDRTTRWMTRDTALFIMLVLGLCMAAGTTGCDSENSSDDTTSGSIVEAGGMLASAPETFSYVAGGTERQMLDFYRIEEPASQSASRVSTDGGSSPRPALVWFHGGGWVTGEKEDIPQIAFDIAEGAGFHLVSVGYRLAGADAEPWPGIIHEVKSAIRWLKLNADGLGIDPNLIIVAGESAGAHLAAMIASSSGMAGLEGPVNPGVSSDVAGAVLFYGPYELNTIVAQGIEALTTAGCGIELNPIPVWFLLDCPLPDDPFDPLSGCDQTDLSEASPATHVDFTDPPMFLASGTADCTVPWQQTLDMDNALNSAGVPHEVSITEGGEHDAGTLDVSAEDVISFVGANVTNSIPTGNGVIVDDVAQDITCDSGGSCTSTLLQTLETSYDASGQNFYILADFASINNLPNGSLMTADTACPSDPGNSVLNYLSLPLIKESVLSLPELGTCLPGATVTNIYKNQSKDGENRIVLPMINGSADEINNASMGTLIKLADDIADTINNDPNADGVAFDLESPTLSENATTVFIGELAKQLSAEGKYIAIFDPKLQQLAPISTQYNNIIALVALYDYGLNPSAPYEPLSVSTYQQHTSNNAVEAYFGGFGKDIPVLFVTPAAATTTLWEHLNVYNTNFPNGIDPMLSETPVGCSMSSLPVNILNQFLAAPPNGKNPLDYYLSQCQRYNNPNSTTQLDYFNASLSAITSGYNASTNKNRKLIGTALYNQKPDGFYGLTCAKNTYSLFDTPSLYKKCLGFYPESISDSMWSSLKQWSIPGSQ
ncbi:MAG: alpha/beta hydrolase [Deltaproteobacteria bacterium]